MNKENLFVALVFYGLLCGLLRCGVFGKNTLLKNSSPTRGSCGYRHKKLCAFKKQFYITTGIKILLFNDLYPI